MSRCVKCYSDKGKGTYCDDCRAVIANEKRLQALAELQENGQMMEKFDLLHIAGEYAAITQLRRYPNCSHACQEIKIRHEIEHDFIKGYDKGFNKGAELERERVLDLVMGEIYSAAYNDRGIMTLEESELKAIISKLRGEKND